MQTQGRRRIPQTIGSCISYDFYQYLIKGYAGKHPTEQKSAFIPREFILETLEKFPNVTGHRFMYGQKEGADPGSRTIVLMPCDDSSADRLIPNLILRPNGYITDSGDRISLDDCWDLLTRHVDRMCSLMPEESRKTVPRGCFFGINLIKQLLDVPGCAGIRYHFGYNAVTEYLPERYESVMEAVDINRYSLNMFGENGARCPTVCGGGDHAPIDIPLGWPFSAYYEGDEQAPEGTLFEMFHYVSPSLFDAVQDKQIYKEHFSETFALVEAGNYPQARRELKIQLDNMMEKYLFVNQ
jgi:hypothetical protein